MRSAACWVVGLGLGALARPAAAHDIRIPLETLRRDVRRVEDTARVFRERPALPPVPILPEDHRRLLGEAEIELALGHKRRALEILMGRLADPEFAKIPEYVETLLLTSQILEQSAEEVGALHYAALALAAGGTPEQMAEAGARWFRVARLHQRFEDRVAQYELWRRQGGEQAAGTELAAEVMYQVGFALKADRRFGEARALLQKVPSESAFGSRAAYLAGVLFVEEGDLANAERWFSAVMAWPLPALPEGHKQLVIEERVRTLAAIAAGRLRYEKGDLEGARGAYAQVPIDSIYTNEACWERAYLELERGARRAALKQVQCVLDTGAAGARHVDAQLFRASLLAHLARYNASIESYQILDGKLRGTAEEYKAALASVGAEGELLFAAMERNAVDRGAEATPGPATLFADAWTNDVDRAYRVDRGLGRIAGDLDTHIVAVAELTSLLSREDPFVALTLRRHHLEQLLQEIRHLEGHAGELTQRSLTASADGAIHDHKDDVDEVRQLLKRLAELGRQVEDDVVALDKDARARQRLALGLLAELRADAEVLARDTQALEAEAATPVNAAARAALAEISAFLDDAAKRAEYGVLDTYWLKKEHRTKAIEAIVQEQREQERQYEEALRDLADEPSPDDAALDP